MIVKNEEKYLEKCLLSVQGLVNEIIIVDTGSTDKTKLIAKKFTDKIYDFEWDNDFSTARNESLKYATGDWIIIIDADEIISGLDHNKVRLAINNSDNNVVGYTLIQRNYTNSVSCSGWVSCKNDHYEESQIANGFWTAKIIRLFKNIQGVKFEGKVHESVYKSLKNIGGIASLNVPLHHLTHVDMGLRKNKGLLYEEIGQDKIRVDKTFNSYFEVGRQQVANGDLDSAIQSLKESIKFKKDFFDSLFLLGSVYLIKGELDNAIKYLEKSKQFNDSFSSVHSNLGIIYVKKREFKKALDNFNRSLKLNPKNANVHKSLGLLYHQLGDKDQALKYFNEAINLNSSLKNDIMINL